MCPSLVGTVTLSLSLKYTQHSEAVMVGFWKTAPPGFLSNELSKKKLEGQRWLLELWELWSSEREEATYAFNVPGLYQHGET